MFKRDLDLEKRWGRLLDGLQETIGKKPNDLLTLDELKNLYKLLEPLTVDDRIFNFKLRPDRADVIIPACEIYIKILQIAGIKEMLVPKIGLSDGMILDMVDQIKGE